MWYNRATLRHEEMSMRTAVVVLSIAATCTFVCPSLAYEYCGDGMVNTPEEECDTTDDADCPGFCDPVTCECITSG